MKIYVIKSDGTILKAVSSKEKAQKIVNDLTKFQDDVEKYATKVSEYSSPIEEQIYKFDYDQCPKEIEQEYKNDFINYVNSLDCTSDVKEHLIKCINEIPNGATISPFISYYDRYYYSYEECEYFD